MAPESALDVTGPVVGDAYVEISPGDPEYSRLARHAVPEAEVEARRQRWRDGDEALRLEFEQYLASLTDSGEVPAPPGGPPGHGPTAPR